jgi:lipopolysaccharide/colanic/teichoic acid biosynthesis glycosyltransferase
MYKFFIKRIFEFTIALLALLILLPIFLTISILVLLKMGTPIFFIQSRPGLNGKTFKMYKFRTMTNKCDKNGNLLEDKDRLSNFGSFLRSTSLDELPALWNVLCGNMSLVGPRPLLIEYLPLYSKNQARRHEVRPGITGWAQVNGRNAISWNEKFELDTWYVENQSFALDMKIILLTLKKVIKRDGISHNNHVTMEKFKGNT